ncbi:MAG: ATP-grasp domain-containing protein [Ardenticatenaceae bacterium]|nr:ATP-grasp domain-containing protein [Anaerolineales bacterium]MCB8920909.1 ATP-grasp domain-containing protein [Ardenticatenaceae bacterium]MCB9005486.1 ATP-grasp domain-containing protein [Ardenticatenaceae bacterium]
MARNNVNILFTSVGRRVELLRAFRRAYQTLNLAGNIVVSDIDPLAPALQIADKRYLVPRFTSPDYVPALVDICHREAIDLVFPLIDPDIPILAQHRDVLSAVGAQVVVVTPEAAEKTADKWQTTQFFQQLGLPTPQSWLPEHLPQKDIDYPLFIKPRRGSAAQHTFKVNNRRELDFFLDYVPDPIIQACLPGPEMTNDVVCGLDGHLLAVVSRQRIEVRWGEVAKGVTIYDADITAACAKVAAALPAVGVITVQCMMKEGIPHFTEINARLGGGVPLGIAAGVDTPRYLLAQVAGLPLDVPRLGTYQQGLYLTRFDDSFFLTDETRQQIVTQQL